jgi:hypothetical protein
MAGSVADTVAAQFAAVVAADSVALLAAADADNRAPVCTRSRFGSNQSGSLSFYGVK